MRNRAVDSSVAWAGTTRLPPGLDHLGTGGIAGINVADSGASVAVAAGASVVAAAGAAVGGVFDVGCGDVAVGGATGVRGMVNVRKRLEVAIGVAGGGVGPRSAFEIVWPGADVASTTSNPPNTTQQIGCQAHRRGVIASSSVNRASYKRNPCAVSETAGV
jgi:hypothetical protein